MKIAVIGAGGIGGYFGGRLAAAGNDVVFLARGKHLQALKSQGLRVTSLNGDFQVPNVMATNQMEEIGTRDLVILGVKSWQVKEIAPQLPPLLRPESYVLPLQNGVLAVPELQPHIKERNLLCGLCKIFSKIEAPGVINHFAVDPIIIFGQVDNKLTPAVQRVQQVLDEAGINQLVPEDILSELWKKFIIICSGGLLAQSGKTYGEFMEKVENRQQMSELLFEVYNVSQKVGVQINENFVNETLGFIDNLPYQTASSLARDIWNGVPSEIDYHNGTVVKLAEEYGVDVPVNKAICEQVG